MRGGPARAIAIAGLVVATALVVVTLLGGGDAYRVSVLLPNAGQLVEGNLVKVGGVDVGTLERIELTADNQARLGLRIEDGDFDPLHRGTRAIVRSTSLSAVAGRHVALEPGPANAPALPDGGTIPAHDASAVVDLDQLLNTLDLQVRDSLQQVVRGLATATGAGRASINRGLETLNPALSQTRETLQELTADDEVFERLVVEAADVATAVAGREDDVEGGVVAAADAAGAVAREEAALEELLERTPAVLRRANTTLVETRAALGELRPALREARPVAPRLARLLRTLAPLLDRTQPVVGDLRATLPVLSDALRELRALDPVARAAFAATVGALKGAGPIVAAARAYTPDVVAGLFNGFGGTTAGYYDANGHYARISFQGNAFSLGNGLQQLAQSPPAQEGDPFSYRSGLTARCPGAATQPAADGSNPWRPPEAAFCDPEHSPR